MGKDIEEVKNEVYLIVERVNEEFGMEYYKLIVLVERFVLLYEWIVYYIIVDCCVVMVVCDGFNLILYEYIVCREGVLELIEFVNFF